MTLRVIHSAQVWLPQTQTWLYNQIRFLPKALVESHVVCLRTQNLEQFHLHHIHCLAEESRLRYYGEWCLLNLRLGKHSGFLARTIEKFGGQILHSHFGNKAWANLKAARKNRIKHAVTFYGHDVNHLPNKDARWRDRYKELFSRADMFLCEGPHMAERLVNLGCPYEKVRVHHLGVPIENIPFQPRVWRTEEPLRILISSRFHESKGIPYALKALGMIQDKINLEIIIIGDAGQDKQGHAEKQKILNVINQMGLQKKVKLLGFQPHKVFFEEAYRSHVFLSPSLTAADGTTEGGAPVSLIEAIASGIPVVSTTHCDIPNVVNYDRDDWLVPERDAEGLADRILWLVDHPDEWAGILTKGREHVETHFDARVQGEKLAAHYQRLGE